MRVVLLLVYLLSQLLGAGVPVKPGYLQQHNGSVHSLPVKSKHHLRPFRIEPIEGLSENETVNEYCLDEDIDEEDADYDLTGQYALLIQQCLVLSSCYTTATDVQSYHPRSGFDITTTPRYITQRVLRI